MRSAIWCDSATREVWVAGQQVALSLSVQEFKLLDLLCSRYGRLCSRDELGNAIWGAGNYEYGMLHRLIHRTKRKLEPVAKDCISAVAGVGYKIRYEQEDGRGTGAAADSSFFAGRENELTVLKDALVRASSGKGATVILSGEAGIGKTRLAEELALHAQAVGDPVLWGRCYEGEGAPPYWPWVQVIRSYIHVLDDDALRAEMGPGAADIAQVVSEVRDRVPDLPLHSTLDGEHAHFRLFNSITTFLRNAAASQPLVLIVDDLHWADKSSLLLLQFLVRELHDARLLVVGTYRDVEVDRAHPLAEVLVELGRERGYEGVRVRALPFEDVRGLITAVGEQDVPDAFAQSIYQETEGNPFFIKEVLRHLVEEGKVKWEDGHLTFDALRGGDLGIPEGVREVIGRRLSRLSEGCNGMLTVAAAMPGGFAWELLEALVQEQDNRLLDFLDEALASQVIRERPGEGAGATYEFTHALIRQTLCAELNTPRRARLHHQIGEAIERVFEADLEPHAGELAYHFSRATSSGDVAKAVGYARRAAERARSQAAFEEAARLYEMSLVALSTRPGADENERCELLLALGESRFLAGDIELSKQALLQAAEAAENLGSGELLARAALAYGWSRMLGLVDPISASLLEKAEALLQSSQSAGRAEVLARLAVTRLDAGDRLAALSLSQQAVEMARRLGDADGLFAALDLRLGVINGPDDLEERLAVSDEMMRSAQGPRNALWARIRRNSDLFSLGDKDAGDEMMSAVRELVEEQPEHFLLRFAAALRAMRALLEGDLRAGEELVLHTEPRSRPDPRDSLTQLFVVRWMQGRFAELEPALNAAVQQLRQAGGGADRPVLLLGQCALAFMHSEMGALDNARRTFEEVAQADFADMPKDANYLVSVVLLSEIATRLEDNRRADMLYRSLLPHEMRNVVVGYCLACLGSVARSLGVLASSMSRWREAERHFEAALNMNEKLGARPWVAYTQHDYACMLRKRDGNGDRRKAGELLSAALTTTRDLGMAALEQKVLAL